MTARTGNEYDQYPTPFLGFILPILKKSQDKMFTFNENLSLLVYWKSISHCISFLILSRAQNQSESAWWIVVVKGGVCPGFTYIKVAH